jgi:hypothetical protein
MTPYEISRGEEHFRPKQILVWNRFDLLRNGISLPTSHKLTFSWAFETPRRACSSCRQSVYLSVHMNESARGVLSGFSFNIVLATFNKIWKNQSWLRSERNSKTLYMKAYMRFREYLKRNSQVFTRTKTVSINRYWEERNIFSCPMFLNPTHNR